MMLLFDDETVTKNHDAAIRRESMEEANLSSIRLIMKKLKYTAQQAMEMLEIPADAQKEYMEKL